MGQVSAVLRSVVNGYAHWCPGCEEMHVVQTQAPQPNGAQWSFDGNVEKPTFAPSIKITSGHYVAGWQGKPYWCTYRDEDGEPSSFTCGICHYFIKDGQIQFCGDSTHALAGQTVPLPILPPHASDS